MFKSDVNIQPLYDTEFVLTKTLKGVIFTWTYDSPALTVYNFALTALHSMTPAASICSVCAGVKPYSCSTSAVCSPITGPGLREGSAGVRDRSGAGRGLSSPLESLTKEPLSWLCGCELTWSKTNTGVTQASVPSKTFDHSAWLLEAKRSAKICLSSGQSSKLIWGGSSPASSSKPRKTNYRITREMLWPHSNMMSDKRYSLTTRISSSQQYGWKVHDEINQSGIRTACAGFKATKFQKWSITIITV